MKLNQFFCCHLYEDKEEKHLSFERERVSRNFYSNYEYLATRQVCIKCGHEKWKTKKVLLI